MEKKMQVLSLDEIQEVSGGSGSWGYGTIPGGVPPGSHGNGVTYDRSFGNGWSLSAGFSKSAAGFEVRYVWK